MSTKQELINILIDVDQTLTYEKAESILMDRIKNNVKTSAVAVVNYFTTVNSNTNELKIHYWFTYPNDTREWL